MHINNGYLIAPHDGAKVLAKLGMHFKKFEVSSTTDCGYLVTAGNNFNIACLTSVKHKPKLMTEFDNFIVGCFDADAAIQSWRQSRNRKQVRIPLSAPEIPDCQGFVTTRLRFIRDLLCGRHLGSGQDILISLPSVDLMAEVMRCLDRSVNIRTAESGNKNIVGFDVTTYDGVYIAVVLAASLTRKDQP